MASRLDRLLLLLDTGASPAIRQAAAKQVAQIATKCLRTDSGIEGDLNDIKPTLDVNGNVASPQERLEDWTEVISTVAKLLPLLRSKNAETRNAASSAISNICSLAPLWTPLHPASYTEASTAEFPTFSVEQLLSSGNLLLSSSGQEFSRLASLGTPADLERARKEAKARLGLDFLDGDDDEDNGWTQELMQEATDVQITEDDPAPVAKSPDSNKMDMTSPGSRVEDMASPMSVEEPFPPPPRPVVPGRTESRQQFSDDRAGSPISGIVEDMSALSARERNRLKRKRKKEESSGHFVAHVPVPHTKIRVVEEEGKPAPKPATSSPVPDDSKIIVDPQKGGQVDVKEKSSQHALEVKPGHWVWAGLMKVLSVDLFNPNWETRHGTSLAIREVIKIQGAHAGTYYNSSAEENATHHTKWCNDMAVKLLCVFVMDRFSDFVSDQVVAPVRETATQALAALLMHMPAYSVQHVHDILLDMIRQQFPPVDGKKNREVAYVWQVRHAGLLGLKYEVAVREDLIEKQESRQLLRDVVEAALLGLTDADDDVRSAAAGCLIPITRSIVEHLLGDLPKLLAVLWGCFESMKDDLGSSISAVMDLLGALVSFPQVMDLFADEARSQSLNQLAPLLFPFFRHSISNVRLAVVRTVRRFILVQNLPVDWVEISFLRILFQNILLEEKDDVRSLSLETWRLALQRITPNVPSIQTLIPVMIFRDWIETCTTPIGDPIDTTRLFVLEHQESSVDLYNVDKNMISQDLSLVSLETVWRARIASTQSLAILANMLATEEQREYLDVPLRHYLASPSYFHKFMGATILQEWSLEFEMTSDVPLTSHSPLANELSKIVVPFLSSDPPACYHENLFLLNQLCSITNNSVDSFLHDSRLNTTNPNLPRSTSLACDEGSFTIAQARLAVDWLDNLHNSFIKPKKKKDGARIEDAKRSIREYIYVFEENKGVADIQVLAAFGAAAISLKSMPPKVTPLIKSIMNSLKTEENVDLQSRSAASLARFIHLCAANTSQNLLGPVDKVIKNLCVFLCQDDSHTPIFSKSVAKQAGILSFNKIIATALSPAVARSKEEPVEEPKEVTATRIMRRGGVMAFVQLTTTFGSALFDEVPKMWQCVSEDLLRVFPIDSTVESGDSMLESESGQSVLDTLTALRDIIPTLDASLLHRIRDLFPSLLSGLQSRFAVIRQSVAKCMAVVCEIMTPEAMLFVIECVLPLMDDAKSVKNRQGATELMFHVVNTLQIKALPYVIFLVVPLLGRMSDPDEDVRSAATNSFATLIKMIPLDGGFPDPPGFPESLLKKRSEERKFLSQLLDGSQVDNYVLPVQINAELRKYQQEGVNWLAFLRKYQLHGILCDDMGLGKTLQSICILASAHHERDQRQESHIPSLIVCPPTLTNHWYHEINKYANNLRPIIYSGPVKERRARLKRLKQFDIVITSYDVVRNDLSSLVPINWLYCILDEGHLIKNAKSKVSQSVKSMQAHHRLILSGTPIQNNLLELWSLFDFLMPGFLGNEAAFNERFVRPVAASKDGKAGAKGAEAAAQALDALHKQVLPFLLRRMKENVLNDLPPKIIQDYYCDVSALQKILFDEFQHSQASVEAETSVKEGVAKTHVFQALQYMRKVCNHPALVMKDDQPETNLLLEKAAAGGEVSKSVRDVEHAPKLLALKQLLQECGIGVAEVAEDNIEDLAAAPPQHRCLIFCQMKMMIDVIETDLLKAMMPTVTYMRLDGTVDAQRRHAVVQTFNDDPSIDCLLLTTHIGGLGLTLTGADTVIFVEHDWNPMKDLQAMDRAHRLGQKRVVNVYRLITKGTLEEKIMGLQRFKLNIANSVVTQQNSGLDSMDTDLVLDLFRHTTDEEDAEASKKKASENRGALSQKDILNGLEELHGDDEYAEMNLESFMSSLGR